MTAAPAAQSAAAVPPTRILGIGQFLPYEKLERLVASQICYQRVTRTPLSQRYQLKRLHKGLRKRTPPVRWFQHPAFAKANRMSLEMELTAQAKQPGFDNRRGFSKACADRRRFAGYCIRV